MLLLPMRTAREVREMLRTILAAIRDEMPPDRPGMDIFVDYGLDSLDQIEFVFQVEEQFHVSIDDVDFATGELRQFDQLVEYLAQTAVPMTTPQ